MADFTITIADADVDRVTNAVCTVHNMENTYANAMQVIMNFINTVVGNYEAQQARASYVAPSMTPVVPATPTASTTTTTTAPTA